MFDAVNAAIAHAYYRSSPVWGYYRSLLKTQYLTPPELRAIQLGKLRRLVAAANARFPFWQSRFATSGFSLSVDSLEALQRLPILEKHELPSILQQGNLPTDGLLPQRSGGTTGQPVTIYATPNHVYWSQACVLRFYHWMGYHLGERRAKLFAAPTRTGIPELTWRNRLRNRLGNLLFLDVLNLTPDQIRHVETRLNQFRPRLIMGYASRMDFVASKLLQQGRALALHDTLIMNAAEPAPADLRDRVARAFNGRFFDHYGTREVGQIADECVAGRGLLVHMEFMLVEIVRDNGEWVAPGEEGEIVVTQLENHGMPVLRYRVGDRAVRTDETGVCGTGLQIIPEVLARSDDVLIRADGSRVGQWTFRHVIKDFPVAEFQAVQHTPESVRVRIVLDTPQGAARLLEIQHALENILRGFRVDLETVDQIPLSTSGKQMSLINYERYQESPSAWERDN
jgi:phenylacetate-CoA ligase